MTRILTPGNDKGFVLIDSLVCLFTAAFILLLLAGSLHSVFRLSVNQYEAELRIVEARNNFAQERILPYETQN
jgi:hypothetical protein